jgi:hypothetical protein
VLTTLILQGTLIAKIGFAGKFSRFFSCDFAENHQLSQRVGAQSVGTMHADVGTFTDGKKTR